MKIKRKIGKRLASIILTLVLLVSGITFFPSEAYAAGWLEYAKETITLGTAVSASIKDGDYYGRTEAVPYYSNGIDVYWHIYQFSMPKDGLLNIYLESISEAYLRYQKDQTANSNILGANGFVIYSASNPDNIVWRSIYSQNRIPINYSTSRAMYYGSTEIALDGGEYYFAVRQRYTNNTPYYLTLSYKEPFVNVSSISLDPTSLSMEPGNQKTIIPTVLPNNATDKTINWQSNNPSVATVENGMVTAVSAGSATITASSADGEITASCPVVVKCEHNYQTSLTPASIEKDGAVIKTCSKCGVETRTPIPRIEDIRLSQTSYIYDGKEHQPEVTVTNAEDDVLEVGKDYTISYSENTANIGTHTVTVNFIGNYEGIETITFTVSPVHVDSISLDSSRLTLNIGSQQKITATVLPDNATDKTIRWRSSNPSVATVNNDIVMAVAVGNAVITATTVDGEETAECTVNVTCPHSYHTTLIPASKSNNGSLKEECTKCGRIRQDITIYAIDNIRLSKVSYIYNGKICNPTVTVTDSSGKTLESSKDYMVTYNGNRKDVGMYSVTITFTGNYKGTATRQFTIYPKSTKITKIKLKRKGFIVNWKKQSAQISGYELAYSTSSNFQDRKAKLVTISKSKTRKTVGGLKKRKRYYVRIRTYKNVALNGTTTKLYSSWSPSKKITTK